MTIEDMCWEDGFEKGQKKLFDFFYVLSQLDDWRLDKIIETATDELKEQKEALK